MLTVTSACMTSDVGRKGNCQRHLAFPKLPTEVANQYQKKRNILNLDTFENVA